MPEGRLQRTRAALPEGYQFGDAGLRRRADGVPYATADGRLIVMLPPRWRAPHENAAEQLRQRSRLSCADLEDHPEAI